MAARSSVELEITFSTPLSWRIVPSMGAVRNASTVSGDDPRHVAETVSRGSFASGSSSIGRFFQANPPSRTTTA